MRESHAIAMGAAFMVSGVLCAATQLTMQQVPHMVRGDVGVVCIDAPDRVCAELDVTQ